MSQDEVVQNKVRRATALNALRKIAKIVAEEERMDASKRRYLGYFLRYGLLTLVAICAVLARFWGVI
jgi:hypothetical protein